MNKKIETLLVIVIATVQSVLFFACSPDPEESTLVDDGETQEHTEYQETLDSLHNEIQKHEQTRNRLNDSIAILYSQMSGDTAINANLIEQPVKIVYKDRPNNGLIEDKEVLEAKERIIKKQIEEINKLRTLLERTKQEIDRKNKLIASLQRKLQKNKDDLDDVPAARNISISDIDIKLYSKRLFNKDKNIEVIEFCFTINENKLADKEKKVIYLCLSKEGDSNTIRDSNLQVFTTSDGSRQYYTLYETFDYKQEEMRVCVEWPRGAHELKPGDYRVTFFIDKVLAGIGTFKINK